MTSTMEHIGIIGAGSMGGGMASLFAEKGSPISLFDTSKESLTRFDKIDKDIKTFTDLESFVKSSPEGQPRIFVLSLPHGATADKLLDQLEPMLDAGDVVLDCSVGKVGTFLWHYGPSDSQLKYATLAANVGKIQNEGKSVVRHSHSAKGLSIGLAVAFPAGTKLLAETHRRGPSMSPGCTKEAYEKVQHLLKAWSAKDSKGNPCVTYIGQRGAGHCVKTIHNGIEQGILSAVCEVYALMRHAMQLSNKEIAEIFKNWDKDGGLRGNFLVALAAELPLFTKGDGIKTDAGIVDDIEDKVVQDADDSEGTGTWTQGEWAIRHVSAPTLATAHCLRLVSANRTERMKVCDLVKIPQPSTISPENKDTFLQALQQALYVTTLASFVQGCNVIARAERDEKWGVNLADCLKIWRGGCIIQSDAIADLIQPIYENDHELINLALAPSVAKELADGYAPLKTVVMQAIDADAVVPSLSATLEYLKSIGGRKLPTNFEEAELDAFGSHAYDVVGENKAGVQKGAHHTEWRPA